jgi:hypothetical protein
MKGWIAAIVMLAACGPDSTPFQIQFDLQRGDSYRCSSDSCALIGMSCDAAMLIRIVDAADEGVSHLQQCEYIEANGELCQLGTVQLDPADIPNHPVRIQVAVWSQDEIASYNPALRAARECPSMSFEPISGEPTLKPSPALWGQAYFDVGSNGVARVTLNCGNVATLDTDACRGSGMIHVTANVYDFNALISVPQQDVDNLTVEMGEPDLSSTTLQMEDIDPLELTFAGTVSQWEGDRPQGFLESACVRVFGNELQAARTLRCVPVDAAEAADGELLTRGIFVDSATIDTIEAAVGGFPMTGVVIGRVLDAGGNPAAGATVASSGTGSIVYLSDDMTTTVPNMTSASGVFVSKDIRYYTGPVPTNWTATLGDIEPVETAIGGTVDGNVTIVLIQLAEPAVTP